jgi:hypothetical protein
MVVLPRAFLFILDLCGGLAVGLKFVSNVLGLDVRYHQETRWWWFVQRLKPNVINSITGAWFIGYSESGSRLGSEKERECHSGSGIGLGSEKERSMSFGIRRE